MAKDVTFCLHEHVRKLNLKDLRYAQQRVERRVPQIAFNQADHGLRQAGFFCQPGHGDVLLFALVVQNLHDFGANGVAQIS